MGAATEIRHVTCDGAFNIRDLGGYPTADGRTTRWRTLYRADGLHRLDRTSADELADLGWQTVLDLRTVAEVEVGRSCIDGAQLIHLPVLQEVWDRESMEHTDDPVAFLVERYLEMLEVGGGALSTAVEILAAPGRRPAVFHCSAGKDRTGVLAALVLSVVGVPDDVIAADYALSAAAMDRLVEWYRREHPELADAMAQQPAQFLACPHEAMHAFLDEARSRYGSVDRYLVGAGTPPASLDSLRTSLVV